MEPWVALIGWVGIVAMLGWATLTTRDRRIRRAVARMPLTAMRDVVDGQRVKLSGIVDLRNPPLTAPLSGRPCAAWSLVVQRPNGKSHETVVEEYQAVEFVIIGDDGTAARVTQGSTAIVYEIDVRVDTGWGLEPTPRLREILEAHHQDVEGFWGTTRAYRAREGVIEHGERVTVVGLARYEPDPSPRSIGIAYRELPQRLVLTGSTDAPLYIIDAPPKPAV